MSKQIQFYRRDPNYRRNYLENARIHEKESERNESEELRKNTRRLYRRMNRTINNVNLKNPTLSPCEKAALVDEEELLDIDYIYDSDPDSPTQSPPPPNSDIDLINCPYTDVTSENVFE